MRLPQRSRSWTISGKGCRDDSWRFRLNGRGILPSVTAAPDPVPTVLEWGGGREAFEGWLNRFYDLIESEAPDVAALFGGSVSEAHRLHVTDWWCEVMGGPATYSEERGGYARMLARHTGLGITAEQRLVFVTLLSRAADDVGLPADPEFRAAIMAYAEWGSRLAVHNSQPGAEVVEQAPVPRWGWGVAPPYQP
ncbi:MAG: group II truncated hemoglobin [Acidobacteriota bacterium]|nr:group II truncated hemoglobin [Acidobacteriota bacterium]